MATFKEKFNIKYGFPKDTSHSIEDISRLTGVSLKGLRQIYSKGMGAFFSNPESVCYFSSSLVNGENLFSGNGW